MQTSIKSIIALATTAIVLTAASVNVKATEQNQVTVLTELKKVNKIEVSGNVELILVQSSDESIKIYDNYYAKNALIQTQNGELRISSFNKETLTVVVYVSNLTSITAKDNAQVKTLGKFNALTLAVNLSDNATAVLNTNTINLSTDVTDQSNLTLTGTTEEYLSVMGSIAKVTMNQFTSLSTSIQTKNPAIIAKMVASTELPDAE